MKKYISYCFAVFMTAATMTLSGCSDFEPTGYTEVKGLATVSNLRAEVVDRVVELAWTLPTSQDIQGVRIVKNNQRDNAIILDGPVSAYSYRGQAMEEENLYTVNVLYSEGHMSEGQSVYATVPFEELEGVSDLNASVDGRSVSLSWKLPKGDVTGIRIFRDGDVESATVLDGPSTECVLRGQPMDRTITYTVQALYDGVYPSKGADVKATIPYFAPKMVYLMTAPTIAELPSDDEQAAATWFVSQPDAELIWPESIATLDADIYSVMWIEIDRNGLDRGWQNLPSEISNEQTIADLKAYSANGGSIFLGNMATQLTEPLGFVPEGWAPTVFGNGDGGTGDDIWTINPYLGWMYKDNKVEGFYDRTAHAIYQGLTFEVLNGFPYASLPLIGPGQREDHNCIWDCNLYGKGSQIDVIRNFEVTTNSLVLATWGQVQDHCVAGLVDFFSNGEHGRCIAMGLAAYEWNQNSGVNPYQGNIEKLTTNILNYLK